MTNSMLTIEKIFHQNGAYLHIPRSSTVADAAVLVGSGFTSTEWANFLKNTVHCFTADEKAEVELEDVFLSIRLAMEGTEIPSGALIQLFLCRFDADSERLSFFNCGFHSLLYYNSELSDVTGLNITDLPLGARESAIYVQHELPVSTGDMIHILQDEHQYTLYFDIIVGTASIILEAEDVDRLPPRLRSRHVLGTYGSQKY